MKYAIASSSRAFPCYLPFCQGHGCGAKHLRIATCRIHKGLDCLVEPTGDDYWPFGERVWPYGLSPATPPIRTLWGTNRIPQKGGGPSPEEVAHVNTDFPLFRIAFAAAAAVFIFLMVHAALEGVSRTDDVMAGLQ